jgi:serine/threonine protein kinase
MGRRRTRRNGGGKIGKGNSGVVYYPALECDDPSKQPKGDYVSKETTLANAEAEFSKTKVLRDLAPSYAIYPEAVCSRKGKGLVFSKYGGYNLSAYFTNLEQLATGSRFTWAPAPKSVDDNELKDIIAGLEGLARNIDEMNASGLYHNDISLDNIVFNPGTRKVYLIDFERMSNVPPAKGFDDKKMIASIVKDFKDYALKNFQRKREVK